MRLILVLFCATLVGCTTTALDRYPNYLKDRYRIQSVTTLADAVIIEDYGAIVAGGSDRVDIVRGRTAGEQLSQLLAGDLDWKGYQVRRVLPASVGRWVSRDRSYIVFRKPSDRTAPDDSIQVMQAPFYIDRTTKEDSLLDRAFFLLYSPGFQGEPEPPSKVIDTDTTTIDAVIFLRANGYSVPVSKQIGQALVTTLISLGTVSVYQTSQKSITLQVVNARNGQVLWTDSRYVKGGVVGEEWFFETGRELLNALPSRNEVSVSQAEYIFHAPYQTAWDTTLRTLGEYGLTVTTADNQRGIIEANPVAPPGNDLAKISTASSIDAEDCQEIKVRTVLTVKAVDSTRTRVFIEPSIEGLSKQHGLESGEWKSYKSNGTVERTYLLQLRKKLEGK